MDEGDVECEGDEVVEETEVGHLGFHAVGAGFEILLPNGVRLHVPSAFDESALHRLVSTLASAC